mgnify:CR=1 FL=1
MVCLNLLVDNEYETGTRLLNFVPPDEDNKTISLAYARTLKLLMTILHRILYTDIFFNISLI